MNNKSPALWLASVIMSIAVAAIVMNYYSVTGGVDQKSELCRYSQYATYDYMTDGDILYCRSRDDSFQKLRLPVERVYGVLKDAE